MKKTFTINGTEFEITHKTKTDGLEREVFTLRILGDEPKGIDFRIIFDDATPSQIRKAVSDLNEIAETYAFQVLNASKVNYILTELGFE